MVRDAQTTAEPMTTKSSPSRIFRAHVSGYVTSNAGMHGRDGGRVCVCVSVREKVRIGAYIFAYATTFTHWGHTSQSWKQCLVFSWYFVSGNLHNHIFEWI